MKNVKHLNQQTFMLFWLGLLTGVLLIMSLYTLGSNDVEDVMGRLRNNIAPSYSTDIIRTDSINAPVNKYSVPDGLIRNGYSVPDGL